MDPASLDLPSPIAVTGASGYIASWIVRYLLEAGVTVHATVRDKTRDEKVSHLTRIADELGDRGGRLELFDADLLEPGSFDAAVEGCAVVMHTASPFFLAGIKDAKKQLVEPALQGTRNVLEACNRASSVTKVVLTSSVAAIYSDNADREGAPGGVFDETVWNESSSLEHNPYSYSKTVAEREAWKIAEAQSRWTLAVINPSFVLGPSLSTRKDSTSIGMLRQMTDGTFRFGAPELHVGMVDVREVAMAHLLAAARSEAQGRHILSNRTVSFIDMGNILRAELGDRYPFPKGKIPRPLLYVLGPLQGLSWKYLGRNLGIPIEFDNRRSREELGVAYRPVAETLREAIEQLERDGLVGA